MIIFGLISLISSKRYGLQSSNELFNAGFFASLFEISQRKNVNLSEIISSAFKEQK